LTSRRINTKKLSAWYDFQAPLYHLWRDDYHQPLVARVADLLGRKASRQVLDAGCGSGLMSVGLSLLHPDWRIEGVDCSPGLLTIARKQARRRGLENVGFRCGDVEALPFADQEFDAAVAAGLFPNLNEPGMALREIHRVLKTGGQLLVIEFDRSTMTRVTRGFFSVMIGGYRLVSAVFSRFRFADGWNIDASTLDERAFAPCLRTAGLVVDDVLHERQHLIFCCRKP
jgi:ubiquinone/menaquinone biosynthesis C-methylase UbiE